MGVGVDASWIDAVAEGVVVGDADDRIAHVNPAGERLLGARAAELEGRPIATIFPERLHRSAGMPLQRYLLARAPALGGRAVRVALLRVNGVELVQEVSVAPIDRGGETPALILTMRRPHEALGFEALPIEEAALAPDTSRSYRAVFEQAPIGILHFDAHGVITACNDPFACTIGSPKEVLVGLGMRSLPNTEVVGRLDEALAGRTAMYEGEYRAATSGKQSWVRLIFSPIVDAEGHVTGGVGIVDDLTERRAIEARLADADRMASLGTLAAGVAHEINNPLAYVRAGLELSERELAHLRTPGDLEPEWTRIADTLQSCREGIERVRAIVSDLKAFSRGDDARPQRVDLEASVDAALSLVANEIRHRARVVKEYAHIPPVLGAETRFVQVFVNLLVNAAQAIPACDAAHHAIVIRTSELPGGRVCVAVRDTGRGIDPGHLGRIFEPFWTDKPHDVGTGLGLAICHGIVTAAGGEILVESVEGAGTTFSVILPGAPVASAPDEAAAVAPAPPAAPQEAHRARVLIIDDESKLAWTLGMALGDRHDVVTVSSGREALTRLCAGEDYDLVLCDLMMPELSGMDVHDQILQHRPDLLDRCVFMTGGAFTDRARAFLQDPDVRRLEKPFLIEDVEALLPP